MKDRSKHTREKLKKDAETRNAERAKLSPTQQLVQLDGRLGKGIGATRERARLQTIIDANKPTPEKK